MLAAQIILEYGCSSIIMEMCRLLQMVDRGKLSGFAVSVRFDKRLFLRSI